MPDVSRPVVLLAGLLLLLSLPTSSAAQDLRLNELVASNVSSLTDEDGTYPDWIELYNAGTEPIDLAGYGLSDDPEEPFKWAMPALTLEPGGYMLVFASGRDQRAVVAHWETVIDHGDTWRFLVDEQPASGWQILRFNDAIWDSGPSGFGYGDSDDATTVPQGTLVTFARTTFAVDDTSQVERVVLHMDYDDGFLAFLNGTEVARVNVDGAMPTADQPSSGDHEGQYHQGLPLDAFEVPTPDSVLQPGDNVLAVQVHNARTTSSDMTMIPVLTLGLSQAPPEPRGLSDRASDLAAARPHASFKLSSDGETVVLTAPDSTRLDSVSYSPLPADVSFGRPSGDSTAWTFFGTPTPGQPNPSDGFRGITAAPVLSKPSGLYDDAFVTVTLTPGAPGDELHYIVGGAVPTENSPPYSGPITLSETTVLRVRAFREGHLPSPVVTGTYLLQEDTDLPIVALVTDPSNLWNDETGIYVMGPKAEPRHPHFGANFWQDWEIPVHVDLIEPGTTTPALSLDGGARIYGGWSRAFPQKSLALYARGQYGADVIDYRLLPDKPIDEYQAFILRNSGNDWGHTLFRDAMMQYLVKEAEVDILAYRPTVVFLNGRYWGIHNLREKINEHYVAANHGVDPDQIDMVEVVKPPEEYVTLHGSDDHLQAFLQYLGDHTMTAPEDYAVADSFIQVESFIDYQAAQIYFANQDWPGNNQKLWRPRDPGGRWRWILYDTDFGFGLFNASLYQRNSLAFATAANGPDHPNPPHSTFMLRRLLLNPTFRRAFVNRFADHLNETFDPQRVVAQINAMADALGPEVPRHNTRWNGALNGWDNQVQRLRDFAERRPPMMWSHLRSFFDLDAPAAVSVEAVPAEGGSVRVNRLEVDAFPWAGQYFSGVPVPFEAVPRPGYRFTGWSGASTSTDRAIHVDPRGGVALTARFEAGHAMASDVVIHEIQYHPPDDLDSEDWVELFNAGEATLDLSGWALVDEDDEHRFVLPEGTQLTDGEYLVLCRDPEAFRVAYPGAAPCVGGWDFGLSSGGDMARLYDADSVLVDSVAYDDEDPWPSAPDGDGATLELVDPEEDNSLAESWRASYVRSGTPGAANSVPTAGEPARERPHQLALHPNHPNPFRDATTIRYDLDRPGQAVLRAYDVLGRQVRRLVDARQPAGTYTVRFETQALTSGVYVLRLEHEGRVHTQTMTVLR